MMDQNVPSIVYHKFAYSAHYIYVRFSPIFALYDAMSHLFSGRYTHTPKTKRAHVAVIGIYLPYRHFSAAPIVWESSAYSKRESLLLL